MSHLSVIDGAFLHLESPEMPFSGMISRVLAARLKIEINERELAERVAAIGPLVDASMGTDQVSAFLRAEHQRWAAAAREIGLLPE